MAVSAEEIAVTYPIPTYRFRVTVGDEEMAFKSVSGLDVKRQTMEYKDGLGNWFQMPGQIDAVNITLSRGIVPRQSQLYDWINSISLNRVEKKDISISLTNESGDELLLTWNVVDAFPTGHTGPSLDGSSNEIAIEQVTLLARRLSLKHH